MRKEEGTVLIKETLITFYLLSYGVRDVSGVKQKNLQTDYIVFSVHDST